MGSKECFLWLCHRIGIKIHEAYEVETIRLSVHPEMHIVEQSLFLCGLPIPTQHVYHIVDASIAAYHYRWENLQALGFCLYHNTPILRLKRFNLMKHECFIKVKHPDNIVIVECICYDSRHILLSIRRQNDILHVVSLFEQRGDFIIGESCYAAADAGDKEGEGRVLLGELDELVHIRTDGLYAALHRRDGVALTLQAHALTHDGPKLAVGDISRTTSVHTFEVAAEHKDLVRLQLRDKLWCCPFLFHNLVILAQIYS